MVERGGGAEAEGDKGTVCKGKVRWRVRGRKEGKKVAGGERSVDEVVHGGKRIE